MYLLYFTPKVRAYLKCFSTLSSFQCICLLFNIDILSKFSGEFAYAHVRTREKKKEHNLVLIKPVTVHSHSLVSSMKSKYLLPYPSSSRAYNEVSFEQ